MNLKYSQHETKSTVRPILARVSQIFSLHLKSEENRWKKSPIFGSVNGNDTKPYPVIHRDHPNADVVIQKIYQHVAGYHTDDHADFKQTLENICRMPQLE